MDEAIGGVAVVVLPAETLGHQVAGPPNDLGLTHGVVHAQCYHDRHSLARHTCRLQLGHNGGEQEVHRRRAATIVDHDRHAVDRFCKITQPARAHGHAQPSLHLHPSVRNSGRWSRLEDTGNLPRRRQ